MTIGIDTVKLSWKGGGPYSAPDDWDVTVRSPVLKRKHDGSQTLMGAQQWGVHPSRGWRICVHETGAGWMEGSLPRWTSIDKTNRVPFPHEFAGEAIRSILSDVGADFTNLVEPKVKRMDIAGDWEGKVSPLRIAMLGASWPRSREQPQGRLYSTTIGRHGQNQVCLYDKGVELGGEADQHGRCELRLVPRGGFSIHSFNEVPQTYVAEVGAIGGRVMRTGDCPAGYRGVLCKLAVLQPEMKPLMLALMNEELSRATFYRVKADMQHALNMVEHLGTTIVELVTAA